MIHIIANPASQSGSGNKRIQTLMKQLKDENIEAALHLTSCKGQGTELARSLKLTEKDILVIIGGDGSMNDLVNGLALPCKAPILLYPSGSGNDFARGLKIRHDPEDFIRILKHAASMEKPFGKVLDLGSVTSVGAGAEHSVSLKDHRFAVSCGFGMDAGICLGLESGKLKNICNRLHIGKLSYLIVGVKTILQTGKDKKATVTVTYGGKKLVVKNTVFVSVHNLPFEGGGFPFAPKASPSDGALDVCIVHVSNRLLMIPLMVASLLGGKHVCFKRWVTSIRCHALTVTSDKALPLHTDGEAIPDQMGFSAEALSGVLSYVAAR